MRINVCKVKNGKLPCQLAEDAFSLINTHLRLLQKEITEALHYHTE